MASDSEVGPNKYRCAQCDGVFEKGWSDEEAAAELDETFGIPAQDCVIICDDCYKMMGLGI